MEFVQCDMCFNFYELDDWEEGNHFICKTCANILSEIKQREIKEGREFNPAFRLALFDMKRELEENK